MLKERRLEEDEKRTEKEEEGEGMETKGKEVDNGFHPLYACLIIKNKNYPKYP